MSPWPSRRERLTDSPALTAAMTVAAVKTPNAVHPAGPAAQASDTTVRNAPATTNSRSSRKRELSFISEHLLGAALAAPPVTSIPVHRRVDGGCLLSGGTRPARLGGFAAASD